MREHLRHAMGIIVTSAMRGEQLWLKSPAEARAAIGDQDVELRDEAIRIAGERRDRAAVAQLLPLLKSDDVELRDRTIGALAAIGDPSTVKPLAELAKFGDLDELPKILDAVARVGGPRPSRIWSSSPARTRTKSSATKRSARSSTRQPRRAEVAAAFAASRGGRAQAGSSLADHAQSVVGVVHAETGEDELGLVDHRAADLGGPAVLDVVLAVAQETARELGFVADLAEEIDAALEEVVGGARAAVAGVVEDRGAVHRAEREQRATDVDADAGFLGELERLAAAIERVPRAALGELEQAEVVERLAQEAPIVEPRTRAGARPRSACAPRRAGRARARPRRGG